MKTNKKTRKNRRTIKRKMSARSKNTKSDKFGQGSKNPTTNVIGDRRSPETFGGVRQSSRLNPSGISIETKPLGDERKDSNISRDKIIRFINSSIQEKIPVIISLPIPPERHAFLRDIGENEDEEWTVYNNFMALLQEKYRGYKFEFFPVDLKLKKEALDHHRANRGSGGCSHYIYKWIEKYNRDLEELSNS